MNWNLNLLYTGFDDPALSNDFGEAEALCGRMDELLAGAQADERVVLTRAVTLMSELMALTVRAGKMVFLTLAADAGNAAAQPWYDRFMRLDIRIKTATSAWARYVGGLSDLSSVTASDPLLLEHEYLLEQLKEKARHTIDPALEPTALAMQVTGGCAWEKLRDMLDATHTVRYSLDDEEQILTLSEARNLAYSSDADVRKAAYAAELESYKAIETPMAAALSSIKGEALTLSKLKRYDSVLSESLEQARITRPVLDAMLGAIEEALPMFRRYLRAKARALKHAGGLPFYDLFAPLGGGAGTAGPGGAYTLESARELLVEVLGGFSPRLGAMVERAFQERWIDAYPRPGKQGGAFCSGMYPLGISYVLTNFDGTLNAVSTLAHELGHAYHDQQLFGNSILNSDAPMTLAETASIFNETLLVQALLARASGDEKLMLLDQELTEATQTVVDILSRYYFETAVFEARKERSLMAEDLKAMMLDAQRRAYGDGLDEHYLHPYMWACKSHYYSAELHFYNFPYAFGLLFGKGIYARFAGGGAGTSGGAGTFGGAEGVEQYEQLLRETGLGDAESVARGVGIELADAGFWRASLAQIGEAVAQFEALVGPARA